MDPQRSKTTTKRKSLKRVARNAILFGALVFIIMTAVVEGVLFIFPTLQNYKREMLHEGDYAYSLIGQEYVEQIYKEVKEVYYSVPDDIKADRFSDEFKSYLIPIIDDDFLAAREILVKCREATKIGNITFTFFDEDKESLVFVLDGNVGEKAYLPGQYINNKVGTIDSLDTINKIMRSDWYMHVTYGKANGFEATNYEGIYDTEGNLIGYISITISINAFVKQILLFLSIYIPIMLVLILFLAFRANTEANKRLINPINSLAQAARQYTALDKNGEGANTKVFQDLNISTNDEIEELWDTMVEMEDDVSNAMKKIRESAAKEERMAAELELAKSIQLSALPSNFDDFADETRFDIYALMTPAKEVGGDFYDFFMIDEDHLCMVIADVSGKGVPAALFMMNSKTLLKNRTLQGGKPSEILSFVNDAICEDNINEMFVTVWLGILTLSTGEVIAANAGHEYPYVSGKDGRYELFTDPHGVVIGAFGGLKYEDYTFTLNKGDKLFLYTDGVPEAQNSKEEFFGKDRILEVLNKRENENPEELITFVKQEIDRFEDGALQFDDITMLNITYYG
ncbi:SpoIIE family protein phosphatase [Butyrivibrio sp. FCS014]|uniref:SpoIIE family protein phosphatase n=1 Tax=Butyrivibrio sp. FCS014 TaxID=1408304 RepID=UPI0004667745|nr:PP2C family protein-serine/threonine phosphatase [Butyrivibrio sp. FCS014]